MNDAEVAKIAQLAHLEFQEDELGKFIPGFNEILEFFEQLKRIPTEDVEPTFHALFTSELKTPLREDSVTESLPAADALREAPAAKDGHFRVPKVIE